MSKIWVGGMKDILTKPLNDRNEIFLSLLFLINNGVTQSYIYIEEHCTQKQILLHLLIEDD